MRYIITILLLLISTLSHSQVSPINDTTWLLQDNLSDEFNANKLDRTKWRHPEYNWGNYGFYYYRFHPNNAYLLNGELLLMADTSNLNTPPYYSGGIQTKDTVYSYGYYEIRAKLPAYTHNNSPCGKGFWPAFWTYYQPHYDSCLIEHDEIDILEPSGYEFEDASTNVMGWHDKDSIICTKTNKLDEFTYVNPSPLSADYHKYAVEWLPDRIIFYFDDIPIYYCNHKNKQFMTMHSQQVVIDLQLDGRSGHTFYPEVSHAFPCFMRVDYFRYYKLKINHGENAYVNNFSAFNNLYGVYESIIATNIIMTPNESKLLRATDITLQSDVYIPLGAELYIIATPCFIQN